MQLWDNRRLVPGRAALIGKIIPHWIAQMLYTIKSRE